MTVKKFIAAALSVLVGAFGYTIVDSAIEDRVSRLESEVYELRQENLNENSETHSQDDCDTIYLGKQLVKSESSLSKLLVRIHNDGRISYITPRYYTPRNEDLDYSETNAQTTTRLYDSDIWYHFESQVYYSNATPGDYYFYITDSSSVISQIDNRVENHYYYNDDYSLVSKPYDNSKVYINFSCSGNTSINLANHRIHMTPYFLCGTNPQNLEAISDSKLISIERSEINLDGTFEYSAIYEIPLNSDYNNHLHFCITNIKAIPSS